MDNLSECVKVVEASLILGGDQNTLRSWDEAGQIQMHRDRTNGNHLFLRSDLERFSELGGPTS